MTRPFSHQPEPDISLLIIDDEELVLKATQDYLSSCYHFKIDTATSGSHALSQIAAHSYDAIISDYEMEEMSGIELLKTIRGQGNRTPFIIFTGKGREEVVIDAFESGADGYVMKGGEIKSQFAELAQKLITTIEKRRTETALKESQEWFQDIFWNSPIGIELFDERGVLIGINPACCDIFGVPSINAIQGFQLFDDPNIPEDQRALLKEGKPVRYITHFDFEIVKNKNLYKSTLTGKRNLDILVTPIQKESPSLSGYLVQVLDITQQKLNQEHLEDQKIFLDRLMETIPSPVFYKERNGRYIGCNHAFEKILGVKKEQLIGKTVYDIMPHDLSDIFNAKDQELITNPGNSVYESRIQFADGILHDVIFQKATIIGSKGDVEGILGLILDVSDRKQTEKALKEREENFRNFFEAVGDMIIVGSQDGMVIYSNRALIEKLGYSQDELKQMHILDLHPEEKRTEAKNIFGSMFRGERDNCPLPVVSKSGTLIPVETRIWLGKWNGKDCIFAIIKDLTAEQEEKQRFEQLFRHNPALMALLSLPDRTFIDVNDTFVSMLGYSAPEVIGKTAIDIDLFVKKEAVNYILERILAKESISDFEIQVRCKDGRIRDGLFFVDVINSQGKEYILAVMIDITRQKELERELLFHEQELIRYSDELSKDIAERKHMEVLLTEKSKELDRYFTSALDLLCIANTKGEFIRVNPEWEHVLGYSTEELEGKIFLDFVHPNDLDKTLAAISTLADQKEITSFENRYRSKDGTYRWIEWRSKPHGETIYAAARDITDRKQIEEAIRQSNHKLRLLTGLTRHDILNLLTAIHGYHEFALESYDPEIIHQFISKAFELDKRVQTIIGFTREYEDFGIASSGWQTIYPIIESARGEISPGNVVIENQISPSIEVYADPIIRKVFTTLLENAIRHGKKLTCIRFTTRVDKRDLIIVCEDDGIGIKSEDKARIFRHGFGSHTGIGLFLSQEMLSITGLSIREVGEYEKGVRFEIIVPDGKWRE